MTIAGNIPHRGLRRVAFYLHLGAGLFLGAWLVLVSLSGSLIVFRPEMEDVLQRPLTRVPAGTSSVPIQHLLDLARAAHPGATFHTVNLPTRPGRSVSFWGHDAHGRSFHAFADPHTGRLLGSALADRNLTEWVYLFHAQLLGGELGERINGVGALAWVGLILSGLVLWIPRKGRPWHDALMVRWQAQSRRRLYDFHRAAGFWTAAPLLLVAITGAYFPFKAPFRWLAQAVTSSAATEDSPEPGLRTGTNEIVPLDVVLATASKTLPSAPPNWIRLPESGRDVFTVRKRLPGEWQLEGQNFIHINPGDGTRLRVDLHAECTPAQRFLRALFPLHAGTFGGTTTRILWTGLGLVPAGLFATGTLQWWKRVRAKPAASSTTTTHPPRT